jgi:hypothetical protein
MDDDAAAVRLLLRKCGFDPPEEDLAALAESYSQTRAMAASLFSVPEARDETPRGGERLADRSRPHFTPHQ